MTSTTRPTPASGALARSTSSSFCTCNRPQLNARSIASCATSRRCRTSCWNCSRTHLNKEDNVSEVTFETRINQYVQVRDKKKEIEARHKEELKPYNDIIEKLETVLLDEFNRVGANSVKTDAG